jgi:hypothetical protein
MTNKQTDWKELCVQLYAALEAHSTTWDDEVLLDRVGSALRRAQPEPEAPTDKELTDEQLLKCFKIATPCYNMEGWRRELDGMRAAIAADRALCARPAVEPEGPTDEELLAAQDQAVASFPPIHPEAEPLSADEYARELEIRKARAILARWGRPAIKAEGAITEPRGCPTPGACSCPTAPFVPPELIRALELAEAALADIGDAERESGDDLAWAEARAAQDLPRIRAVLARWGSQPSTVAHSCPRWYDSTAPTGEP